MVLIEFNIIKKRNLLGFVFFVLVSFLVNLPGFTYFRTLSLSSLILSYADFPP